MNGHDRLTSRFWAGLIMLGLWLGAVGDARAHCDTLDGPVVKDAQAAVTKGDVTPVLKWVRESDEPEIRKAFEKTLTVRTKGEEAQELADRYFFETLVRVHRAGEGAPYTGLKPAGTEIGPAVAQADAALAGGSEEKLVELVTEAVAEGIRERFAAAHEAREHAEESVAAGREFVAAYVIFVHYAEGLYEAATRDVIRYGGNAHDSPPAGVDHAHEHPAAEQPETAATHQH